MTVNDGHTEIIGMVVKVGDGIRVDPMIIIHLFLGDTGVLAL